MSAEAKLAELNLELPPAPKPAGTYQPVLQVGRIAYVSGHGPVLPDGELIRGKVGAELSPEDGARAARQVGLTILATLRSQLGSLDRIERFVKALGLVNAAPDFQQHPQVINGFSDLVVEVFGDAGRSARSAVGAASLPGNIAVEIEAVVQLKEQ